MDAVVIGTFLAVGGTILVGVYAAYKFYILINSNNDSE
jgi:hypothetical protein